jgi:hypothetical protein
MLTEPAFEPERRAALLYRCDDEVAALVVFVVVHDLSNRPTAFAIAEPSRLVMKAEMGSSVPPPLGCLLAQARRAFLARGLNA